MLHIWRKRSNLSASPILYLFDACYYNLHVSDDILLLQEEEIRRLNAKIRHAESEESVLVERLQVIATL